MTNLTPAQRLRVAAAVNPDCALVLDRDTALQLARHWEQSQAQMDRVRLLQVQYERKLADLDKLAWWVVRCMTAIGVALTVLAWGVSG